MQNIPRAGEAPCKDHFYVWYWNLHAPSHDCSL